MKGANIWSSFLFFAAPPTGHSVFDIMVDAGILLSWIGYLPSLPAKIRAESSVIWIPLQI